MKTMGDDPYTSPGDISHAVDANMQYTNDVAWTGDGDATPFDVA